MDSIHRIGRDSGWQQSGITHILINAIHWLNRPYSAPWSFDSVIKNFVYEGRLGNVAIAMCVVFPDSVAMLNIQ